MAGELSVWLSPTKYCTVRVGDTRFFSRRIVSKRKYDGFFLLGKEGHVTLTRLLAANFTGQLSFDRIQAFSGKGLSAERH